MKKSFKQLMLLGVMGLVLAILVACGGDEKIPASGEASSSGETQVLKVAFNQPENHPQYKAMEEFGEKFKELTDGAYEIDIFPNELLGAQRETVELVQTGTIQMSIVAGSLLENFNEDFAVFNLPYVFESAEHQMSVLSDEEIVGDLYSSLKDQGLYVAGAFHSGVRNVYNSKKPINTPEDLKGLKIRIIESDTNIKMMEQMGGTGTPMGQGEVYTAIQSGVIDGGENNELIFANLKHAEISPYYSYTNHLMLPDFLLINSQLFDGMSEEHQQIFKDELAKAIDHEVEMWDEDAKKAIADAEAAGATFNEVDVDLFRKATEPVVQEKLTSENAKKLYEKVREAAK
ncbi:TRAP transporter substrate-binding protein [Ureibacillus chungkukjangi]|uniref:Tripartite ATP-independent transporter DctP family solute receptor n=1 Tax=Ureibacillus chungkukjangi TaxID=1202712 RepID=A0A318TNY0_9BACL|nr:TRAP transporter substrate-binding protein [Ureibacillus chungkukjangi]MCM3390180.1 TRAP transporter substrate-binding protein [Ureibacillus chungkukjangi]PYF05607.1 tripartite ATP-independent transporter DctP family solute receptor [Ureibacillus chungkukjangi]